MTPPGSASLLQVSINSEEVHVLGGRDDLAVDDGGSRADVPGVAGDLRSLPPTKTAALPVRFQ
jgi:hypothetical protein